MKNNKQNCCDDMKYYLELDDPDIIKYVCKFDEYGIIIQGMGNSFILISYCQWCGRKLPDSKRDLWFDKLEELGLMIQKIRIFLMSLTQANGIKIYNVYQ